MAKERNIEKRGVSFLIILIVYILAALAGLWVYSLLKLSYWLNLLIADVSATVVVFIFSCVFRNASVSDHCCIPVHFACCYSGIF